MLRASAVCESAGVPACSLATEGFLSQARATSVGLGLPGMPVAMIPGHVAVQSAAELRRNVLEVTLPQAIAGLTGANALDAIGAEPDPHTPVFEGTYDEINAHYIANEWSDGLPIVPPTRERIEAFLACTGLAPDTSLGTLLPDNRAATVWSVAVNGVMAGCRPEYMPVLVALAQAMADPAYGVEHSGNTPGGETLIVVNGPIVKELGFNYTQGVMRDGFQANTSIGRFWRLYLRNVAGFLPHKTDKATFGNTWRVAIAENEDELDHLGWPAHSEEFGIARGENAVSIGRYTAGGMCSSMAGSTPEELVPFLADGLVRHTFWQITFTVGIGYGQLRPLVLMSPIIARTFARGGWSKADVKRALFEHARMPAWQFERLLRDWQRKPIWSLTEEARAGRIPAAVYLASEDPERLVPIVWEPGHFHIVVTGDPLRTSSYVFGQNGQLGFPVGKRIAKLPSLR